MPLPLTQADLNVMRCSDPYCTSTHPVLFVHSACHPKQPVQASYDKSTGVLTTTCARCGRLISEFAIERGGDMTMSEVTQKPEEEAEAAAEVEAEEPEAEEDEGEEEGEEEAEAPASN